MLLRRLLLLVSLGTGLFISFVLSSPSSDANTAAPRILAANANRANLLSLFDFDRYKRVFNKNYARLEDLWRKHLFLARCLNSFTSGIRYKLGLSSSHQALNSASDRTRQELDALYFDRAERQRPSRLQQPAPNPIEDDYLTGSDQDVDTLSRSVNEEAGDIRNEQDLEQKIANISGMHRNEPIYRDFSDGKSRHKRDAAHGMSLTSSDDMIRLIGGKLLDPLEEEVSGYAIVGTNDVLLDYHSLRETSRNALGDQSSNSRSSPSSKIGFNHDLRDCFGPVLEQGDCRGCYLFATLALFEWHFCKHNKGEKQQFSEQFSLDCGPYSCRGGGWPEDIVDWSFKYGLERLDLYPYFERKKTCLFPKDENKQLVEDKIGYWKVHGTSWSAVMMGYWEKYLQWGPIIASVNVDEKFDFYGGGIDHLKCRENKRPLMHAMIVVGSGQDNGQEFWLMRNSFGEDWGEQGYYRLSKESALECVVDDDSSNGIILEGGSDIKFELNTQYESAILDRMAPKWIAKLEDLKRKLSKRKKNKF